MAAAKAQPPKIQKLIAQLVHQHGPVEGARLATAKGHKVSAATALRYHREHCCPESQAEKADAPEGSEDLDLADAVDGDPEDVLILIAKRVARLSKASTVRERLAVLSLVDKLVSRLEDLRQQRRRETTRRVGVLVLPAIVRRAT